MQTTIANKKSIVFLPGWNFKADIWQDIADLLPEYSCTLLNLPPNPTTHLTSTLLSNCPKDAAIVGWSLGGLIGTALASEFPEHFSHLICLASTPRFTSDPGWHGISHLQANKQLASAENNMQRYQQQFLNLACYPNKSREFKHHIAASQEHANTPSLLNHLQLLFTTDLRQSLATSTTPLLQIVGEHDLVITKQQSLQSTSLREHTVNIIPDAGHLLIKSHQTNIASYIRDFIC